MLIYNLAITPKNFPVATLQSISFSPLSPWQSLRFFVTIVLPFLEHQINEIIQSIVFCIWFPSFNIMLFRFIRVVMNQRFAPLLLSGIYGGKFHNLFIYLADGHLGCFQFLTIVIKPLWICEYKSLYVHMFSCLLGKYSRMGLLDGV